VDVRTVCLGLLTFGEASGYDIKKHVEAGFSQFFATGFGSIYPALASLADEGLASVRPATGAGAGRASRKVYRITPAGRTALRSALASCEPTHRLRSEFMALLYFSQLVPPARLRTVLDTQLARMQGELARMRRTGCPGEQQWPGSVRFVQGLGIALLETTTAYLDSHRHLIETPAAPARAGRNRRRSAR
jgi:DNA-binding PadR family transcriptional regulator